ncbi:FUSC family protein [Thermaerobacillus caldiproteolyticus]|uniref:FUSC family protein n=1 Tax=Thermaerobacillus caldiproteolyticus TaxID=247480 RepID=UPI00188D8BFA|nr:FUSC family protein [Anoxybacillus caldiproteolyticus]QPA30537.1 FUSC family protein [Anoxybacillus caldiproteolyticus]
MSNKDCNRRNIFNYLLQWDNSAPVPKMQIFSTALGMALPIIFGALIGHVEIGFIVALGGLFIPPPNDNDPLKVEVLNYVQVIFTGFIAISLGASIGNNHSLLASIFLVFINGFVSLVGGINRTLAVNSVRFTIFFIIGTGISLPTQVNPFIIGLLFSLGSIWAAFISLFFSISYLFFMKQKKSSQSLSNNDSNADFPTQFRYWLFRLKKFQTWFYTIRLVLCLSIAQVIQLLSENPHAYWISLTIVLVLQRNTSSGPSRIYQRAVGTFFGVLIGGIVLIFPLSILWIIVIVALIGGVRSYLKVRNYAVYSMVMTPLLFILLSRGKQISFDLIIDRLMYTFVGCTITLVFGYYIWTGVEKQKLVKK